MKNVTAALVAGAALTLTMGATAHAFLGPLPGITVARPAITLVASKKKKKARKSGKKSSVDPYTRAWELCRRRYGHTSVARVRTRSDGKIVCYLYHYSPYD